ncbi:uncharacterized protein G2W53_025862 [Senna tora]|uniref:Uncharacterized protein n=1 Tax=Senna tora TaxID=362788 RepID=A0A834TE10_9FABA|nr:uncharacterized protein G2W53_025862 [Senna tora]
MPWTTAMTKRRAMTEPNKIGNSTN